MSSDLGNGWVRTRCGEHVDRSLSENSQAFNKNQLVAFRKVHIAAGATAAVSIDIGFEDLAYAGEGHGEPHREDLSKRHVPRGSYVFSVGGSSATDSLRVNVDLC